MASKLYPTLSAFYKAENIGFGSEEDAILCGVPEEKLYRKQPRQRPELSMTQSLENVTDSATDKANSDDSTTANAQSSVEETTGNSAPLMPSAPPLLEMLDFRLQEYLGALIAQSNITFPPQAGHTTQPPQQASPNPSADLHLQRTPETATVTSNLTEELQPDYDDLELTPEELADEILNNLDVTTGADHKDREKSLSLLRGLGLNLGLPGQENHDSSYQVDNLHSGSQSHHYIPKPSTSNDRNENSDQYSDDHQIQQRSRYPHYHHYHHHHHHYHQRPLQHHSHLPSGGGSQPDLRRDPAVVTDRTSVFPPSSRQAAQGRQRQRDATANQECRESGHRHHGGGIRGQSGQRDARKLINREGSTDAEKENKTGSPPAMAKKSADVSDYNAWMTWRKQVNRQLATVILLKQHGKEVSVNNMDMRRKPLRQSSIDFVSQIATQGGSTTSLGGKPYVMYGIPRASLLPQDSSNRNKRDD